MEEEEEWAASLSSLLAAAVATLPLLVAATFFPRSLPLDFFVEVFVEVVEVAVAAKPSALVWRAAVEEEESAVPPASVAADGAGAKEGKRRCWKRRARSKPSSTAADRPLMDSHGGKRPADALQMTKGLSGSCDRRHWVGLLSMSKDSR